MRLFEGTQFDIPPRCEKCGKLEEECDCPPEPPEPPPQTAPEKQTARLAVEKRKRGGVVTVIRGIAADENDLPALLKKLKSSCAAGGAIKGDVLEVQGEQLERVRKVLSEIGYRLRG